MLKISVSVALLLAIMAGKAVFAESDEERFARNSIASLQLASQVLSYYGPVKDDKSELVKGEPVIEGAWQSFLAYQGREHPMAHDLALVRARSVTASNIKSKIVPAWNDAVQGLPPSIVPAQRISLYLEAANASTQAQDYKSAGKYYSLARTLAILDSSNADKAQLYMRLHELKSIGVAMDWRPLRDALSDLRKYSEQFALWTIPRLDALLGEAEIRVELQPDVPEKRTDLAELKANIELSEKGMGGAIPPAQLARLRSLFYVLEDRWEL
ncbi:hypothetical protein [Kordiimonas pumila]|uniref:Uncharacterized protein n=1 Tax=Kordiimonas pumila TaxID=2161677 RepID=A0ABV7D1T4_9PROT|nr:hypothetical protein [Kordiimonas pumila]